MKQYLLKAAGIALCSIAMAGAFAQEKEKSITGDDIIIRKKTDKDAKLVIEIIGGEVKVNGKAIADYNDDDVSIVKRKRMTTARITGTSSPTMFRTLEDPYSYDLRLSDAFSSNRAVLGVTTTKTTNGVKVNTVSKESAAEKAGIKTDDVIKAVNDAKIEEPSDLSEAISKKKAGDKVTVTVTRDGKDQKLTATLQQRSNIAMNFGEGLNGVYNYSFGGKRLGIKAQETEDDKGVKVLDVDDESIAEKAGILEGDIIMQIDGSDVKNVDDLRQLTRVGMDKNAFKVKLSRDGKSQDLDVKIPKKLKTASL